MISDEQLADLITYYQEMISYEETAYDWAGVLIERRNSTLLEVLKELQQRRQKELENIKQADSIWNAIMLGRVSFVHNDDGTFSIVPKKE